MKLTPAFLRKNSLPQSYERGEDYYHRGLVSELVKSGDEYTAKVWGAYQYKVWIGLVRDKFEATCSCPFEDSTLCKHIVAVSLGIIDEAFDKIIEVGEYDKLTSLVPEVDFFENYFTSAHPTQKDVFLSQLLKKNEKLREEFIRFTQIKEDRTVRVNLDLTAKEVIVALENCDLEEATIKKVLEREFAPFYLKTQEYVAKGRLDELLRILLAIYEGVHLAKFQHDNYEALEITNSLVDEYLNEFISSIESTMITVKDASNMIYLIFERWDKRKKEAALHRHLTFEYKLEKFIPLLSTLVSDTATAQALRLRLEAYGIYNTSFANLYLQIAAYQNDHALKQKIMNDFS